jgi:RHS repeat-associated protein
MPNIHASWKRSPVLIKDSSYDDSYQVIDEVVDAKNLFSPTGIQTNLAGANPSAGYPKNLQPTDDASPLLVANSTGGGVGYNTEITDPTTGYQLLGSYRCYDPVSGRFLQPDYASPGIGGINPYAYTYGKFVGCSDPTGHYTYTYQSYNVAKEAIKRAAERQGSFWSRVGKSYLSVAINIIKHPTNPSGYVAAAMLYCNPSAPLVATVMGEIGKESAVGAFMSGAYAGINSAYISTASLGLVQYNPQTGLGGLNTLGVGNCLGLLSLGYLNMSANGEVQVHAGHSLLTHLENEGKGLGDFVENMVSGMASVAIGLCYDMPMDFAHGEYYEEGKFAEYAGEYMGKQIVNQSLYLNNFNNLNMTDPRSPWSTVAWQNMLYRQGPYTADKN